jgi:hypothetical protein
MTSLRELLSDLEARGRVPAGIVERAERSLSHEREKAPWYLTLLMGAGAWLATIFFLIGAGLFLDFGGGWGGWASVALIFLALGLGARRFSAHVFVAQFSLGLTLAGWACGVVAGGELLDADFIGFVASGSLLAVVVYLLHPDAAPRFFVSLAAISQATIWFFVEFDGGQAILRNVPAIGAAIGAGLLLARPGLSRGWLPLGHASAVTLALILPFLSVIAAPGPTGCHWSLELGGGLVGLWLFCGGPCLSLSAHQWAVSARAVVVRAETASRVRPARKMFRVRVIGKLQNGCEPLGALQALGSLGMHR